MKVKFCGITRVEDAEEAVRLGAWAIGLNFWNGSPRYCDPGAAVEISAAVRRSTLVAGVFVNATLDEVAHAAEDFSLAMVQLHGDEGPDFCREAARRTGCKVIKALRVRSGAEVQSAEAYRTDFHLLDAAPPGRARAAPARASTGSSSRERESEVPLILAGGLRPDNVAEAVAVARPFAVDVASGDRVEPRASRTTS